MINIRFRRLAPVLLLTVMSGALHAGGNDRWTLSDPSSILGISRQDPGLPVPAGQYDQFVEVSLSDEIFEFGYRQLTQRKRDYYGLNVIVNDDDDFLVSGRLVRQGYVPGEPLRFGVGIGAFGVWLDEPDESVYAIALIGVVEYDVRAMYPSTVTLDVAAAPGVSTFDDGEDLLELKLRLNVDLSPVASGFIGYRLLEVDTDTGEQEVDKGIHLGIRLAL